MAFGDATRRAPQVCRSRCAAHDRRVGAQNTSESGSAAVVVCTQALFIARGGTMGLPGRLSLYLRSRAPPR